MTMMNNTAAIRLPAEWEPQQAVMLAWPHALTDWHYMLDDVRACYRNIAAAIVRHAHLVIVTPDVETARANCAGLNQARITYICEKTNDTWARDFGPLTTVDADGRPTVNDFKFNGWGLKFAANLDNLITSKLYTAGVFSADYLNRLGFVLEGGSIESDGAGTILTTSECLLSPNRNGDLSRDEIERRLCEYFGARRVLWLDHGALEGDDTDSHIDTLARLAPHDTILYVKCDEQTDSHHDELAAMERELMEFRRDDGMPYNLIALPLPDPVYDEDGERLPATYANFLVLNDAVLLPIYNQKRKDLLASQIMRIAFPDHEIVTVDCSALIRQHGSLHCVTMQLPPDTLKI